MHFDLRVGLAEGLHAVERNPVVALAKVGQHRHLGGAGHFFRRGHATAVVRHGGRQALQLAGRAPGQQAAPAVAHDAHLAAAVLRGVVDGGLDVGHHARRGQGLDGSLQAHAGLHVVTGVAQLHALLDAVEGGRRHSQVAAGGIAVGHRTDVRVHAKNLLQHHHGATGGAFGLGDPGGGHKTVTRCQINKLSHAECSFALVNMVREWADKGPQ